MFRGSRIGGRKGGRGGKREIRRGRGEKKIGGGEGKGGGERERIWRIFFGRWELFYLEMFRRFFSFVFRWGSR